MKCYRHYDRDAVSTCLDCGKALCPTCSEKFSMPICDGCNLVRIKGDRSQLIKNTVIMIVLFILGFAANSSTGVFGAIIWGYFFAGIPWGWSALNRITPNIFLIMPVGGWIIYFLVKCVLSLMIGMFVTPFKIYQITNGLKQAKQLEEYTINKAS